VISTTPKIIPEQELWTRPVAVAGSAKTPVCSAPGKQSFPETFGHATISVIPSSPPHGPLTKSSDLHTWFGTEPSEPVLRLVSTRLPATPV
jgi:hypothetical protein